MRAANLHTLSMLNALLAHARASSAALPSSPTVWPGRERFRIVKVVEERPVLVCEVEYLPSEPEESHSPEVGWVVVGGVYVCVCVSEAGWVVLLVSMCVCFAGDGVYVLVVVRACVPCVGWVGGGGRLEVGVLACDGGSSTMQESQLLSPARRVGGCVAAAARCTAALLRLCPRHWCVRAASHLSAVMNPHLIFVSIAAALTGAGTGQGGGGAVPQRGAAGSQAQGHISGAGGQGAQSALVWSGVSTGAPTGFGSFWRLEVPYSAPNEGRCFALPLPAVHLNTSGAEHQPRARRMHARAAPASPRVLPPRPLDLHNITMGAPTPALPSAGTPFCRRWPTLHS